MKNSNKWVMVWRLVLYLPDGTVQHLHPGAKLNGFVPDHMVVSDTIINEVRVVEDSMDGGTVTYCLSLTTDDSNEWVSSPMTYGGTFLVEWFR